MMLRVRIRNLEEKMKGLPCLVCRGWIGVNPWVLVVERYEDPLPFPRYCPKCGRITYNKVILRSMWEAL